jgi:Flp pilus assembly pilin Flp
VGATDGRAGEGEARTTRRLAVPARPERGSRGASSVEYGLMIAAICAVLCVGVGVALHSVFNSTFSCIVGQLGGGDTSSCSGGAGAGGGGGTGGGGTGGGGTLPTVSPSPSPSASPSPSSTP